MRCGLRKAAYLTMSKNWDMARHSLLECWQRLRSMPSADRCTDVVAAQVVVHCSDLCKLKSAF